MLGYIIQRLLQAVVVMLVISALVFCGVYAVGNPIDVLLSPDATQQIREEAIRLYGLDQPLCGTLADSILFMLEIAYPLSHVFGVRRGTDESEEDNNRQLNTYTGPASGRPIRCPTRYA